MSKKINQIQTSLLELSGGDFQKLGDAYLKAKGYDQINSIGSVIGKNKVRKGTPDTLIPLPNGKYVFVEHTTEQKIFQKIKKDLEKCFDEVKTGIPIKKIQQIIYCHTSKSAVNTSEIESIREMCQKQGVNIDILGIDTISYDLYEKYPGIARDFLNIEVDTGQIVSRSEFITDYNKNPITTPIDTNFQFRETELKQILLKLEQNNLVTITGKAGVGKTRLVLECCEQFVQCFPEYQSYCVRFREIDIFNDLKVYFSKPGHYMIFVDDANRINDFRYFIDCLNDQREDQQIKIIATVRDYAFDQIKQIAETYNSWNNLEIQPLEDKQIQAIIKHQYNSIHSIYVDRIVDISQGNPRLAIMAAQVVIEKQTIESIIDVSSLYDQYYQSIRKDLDVLGNESYLKTAAIISFFRVVDQSNQEKMNIIETVFNISSKDFWSNACKLHSLELLDMYENEIVKTSDQVLANYLFYLAFFDKKIIDFSVLLNNLFPQFKYLLVDVINPIISNFDKNKIKAILRPGVDQLWKKYQEEKDETKLTELIKLFWFLDLTKVLKYVKQSIDQIEMESVEFSNLEIKANNNIYSSPLLEILTLFSQVDQTNLSIALQLLFKYLEKRPTSISSISSLLTEKDFGFDHNSYLWDFMVQHTVIDLIIEKVNQDKKLLFSKLFIAVSEKYLHTHFNSSRMTKTNVINVFDFDLPDTPKITELRDKIWDQLFRLYHQFILQEKILILLYNYIHFTHPKTVTEILKKDSLKILTFIESRLNPNNYSHCYFVQEYLFFLERHQISFNQELGDYFTNETYALHQVLFTYRRKKNNYDLSIQEYEKQQQQKLEIFFKNYNFSDYTKLFERGLKIYKEKNRICKDNLYSLNTIVDVLMILSNRNSELYIKVLKYYLELGNQLKLYDFQLINRLLEIVGVQKTYEFLKQPNYHLKTRWLLGFYYCLPEEEIQSIYIEELYQLFEVSQCTEELCIFNFLLKYQKYDDNVIIRIIEIVLTKNTDSLIGMNFLQNLFYSKSELHIFVCSHLLKDNLALLKKAYFTGLKIDSYIDDDLEIFKKFIDADNNFIIEYIDWLYDNHRFVYFANHRDFSFLWEENDYEQTFSKIIEHIYERSDRFFKSWKNLFKLNRNSELQKRQDIWLTNLIKERSNDFDFIYLIFDFILYFSEEKRCQFIALFIENNKSFEHFKRLPLEANTWTVEGSWVPVYQKRIEYFQSLLPLLNTVDYLEHRQYIEKDIQSFREYQEDEKKREFFRG